METKTVWLVENRFIHAGITFDWSPMQTVAWREKSSAEDCMKRFIANGTMGEFRVAEYKRTENA